MFILSFLNYVMVEVIFFQSQYGLHNSRPYIHLVAVYFIKKAFVGFPLPFSPKLDLEFILASVAIEQV